MKKTFLNLFLLSAICIGYAQSAYCFSIAGNYIISTTGARYSDEETPEYYNGIYDPRTDTYYYPLGYASEEDLLRPGTHIVGRHVVHTTGMKKRN